MDQVTRVSHQGWGSRLGDSFKGILFGILVVLGGIGLLFWGEGRAVKRAKALEEGAGVVVTVDNTAPSTANEGRLVHFTGTAEAFEPLRDTLFGVETDGLKLRRRVEMYQWTEDTHREERKKAGGSTETITTYTYEKEWSSKLIDSSRFEEPSGHQNPSSKPFDNKTFAAEPIVIGDWILGQDFVDDLNREENLSVNQGTLDKASDAVRSKLTLWNGGFYAGANPDSPQVGDVRVRFAVVPQAEVSVVGLQQASKLVPYTAKVGGDIALLSYGVKSSEEMFEAAKAGNTFLTWLLRAVGFFIIMIGFSTILRPFAVAADLIPFLGNLAEKGIGLAAFLLAAVVSLTTIAIGWIFYRPLLGITLLAVVVGLTVWLMKRAAANPGIDRWSGQAPPPPPPV